MGEIVNDGRNCFLCSNIFDDPRILPCGHSFCLGCLTSLFSEESSGTSKVTFCPECENQVTCYNRDPRSFPVNASLVRSLNGETASDDPVGAYEHLRTCRKHSNEEKDQFCAKCQLAVCTECLNKYHNGKPHYIQSFDKANQKRQKLWTAMNNYNESLDHILEWAKTLQSSIEDFKKDAVAPALTVCDIYVRTPLLSDDLKDKHDNLRMRIGRQNQEIVDFHSKAVKDMGDKLQMAKDALNELSDELSPNK